MNEILMTLLSMSLSGTLFIGILSLLTGLFRKKFSKTWQYYIWLLVVLRLLLPFCAKQNLTDSLLQSEAVSTHWSVTQQTTDTAFSEISIPQTDTTTTAASEYTQIEQQHEPLSMSDKILFFILIIALLLFGRKITIYQSFVRFVKAGRDIRYQNSERILAGKGNV